MGGDFWLVVRWWGTLFLIGAVAFPLAKRLFSSATPKLADQASEGWYDHGYLFAKAVGMATVTFFVYVAGSLHLLPFTTGSVIVALVVVFLSGLLVLSFPRKRESKDRSPTRLDSAKRVRSGMTHEWAIIILEELFFFAALLFWSWIKGHEASIHGLEKFMDFGFTKVILNSAYFPAADMWYAGLPINYYYFGHTVLAVLTKLSGIDLAYTFNLMLASLFAFTLTMSFSIGAQLFRLAYGYREKNYELGMMNHGKKTIIHNSLFTILSGLLTAWLVTLAGNMQTIYAFTKGYIGDNVQPFWHLLWAPGEFFTSFQQGLDRYWYANATRFIPFTIHEFPSYSFVVSDIHGHVLSLPFVLLAIGLLIAMFGVAHKQANRELGIVKHEWGRVIFYGFLCGILLMTNALDGPIYFSLFIILFVIHNSQFIIQWKKHWKQLILPIGAAIAAMVATSIPFLMHFKSFVTGLAINCPPAWFADRKVGPFLFEGVEKCQHSPAWMLWLLWGFFIYCGVAFIASVYRRISVSKEKHMSVLVRIESHELVLGVFLIFSLLLLVFPELFYFKDIYPAHFRSNTMFKLGYQAFIMLSIIAGYTIVRAIRDRHTLLLSKLFLALLVPQLILVSVFPIFSVRSYFNSLREYKGLYGLSWLSEQYPDNHAGILWLNSNVAGSGEQGSPTSLKLRGATTTGLPVIVEADGDSYTDYAQFSAFTGLPTVIGWPVHEWLWRGTYDVVAPRREEVRKIYESTDEVETMAILAQYRAQYIIVGSLERQKYTNLQEAKIARLGEVVFTQGATTIYRVGIDR